MKKETLKEASERLYPIHIKPIIDKYDDGITNVIGEEDVNEDCRDAFINGANWEAERRYSEEDMLKFVEFCRSYDIDCTVKNIVDVKCTIELFEQYKKK
jgi:hypothetical protein